MNVFAQAQSKNAAENQKRQEEFRQIRNERPKFCIHCGAPLEDEDEFCTECGEKIESVQKDHRSDGRRGEDPP